MKLRSDFFDFNDYDESRVLRKLAYLLIQLGLDVLEEEDAISSNSYEFCASCESKNCYCYDYDYDHDYDSYKDSQLEEKDDGVSSSDQSSK